MASPFLQRMLDEASAPLGAAAGAHVDLDPPPLLVPSLLSSPGERPSPTPETTGSRRFSYSIVLCVSSQRQYAALASGVRYE